MLPKAIVELIVRSLKRSARRYRGSRGVGQEWERLAEKKLKAAGYRVLERNFRTRVGELDFVAEQEGVLCFIEVKGRRTTQFGMPEEAVTGEKQRRIFRAAQAYLQRRRRPDVPCRFDVVAILETESKTDIRILQDAFCGPPPPRRR
ncbi:MAG TPA: YraN family protein [Thermoanaerobaculia bacterium]|nr:YraN family protein [Thermoanaerobaculia bacterium]